MTPTVRITGLAKRYPGFALRDITFDVPPGSITGVFGPSGAGKTTLMRLIANQHRPDAGTVSVFGLDHAKNEKEIKNRIGFVGEEQFFYPDKTVDWIARFVAACFREWDWSRFEALLRDFGIEGSKKIRHLSRGRKTLLAIAIALSHRADLLILDEPTAGLDMVIRRRVLGQLRDFAAEEGRAVIISSHITDSLGDLADYVVILNDGAMILHDEKDAVLSRWKWVHFKEGALAPSVVRKLSRLDNRRFGISGLSSDIESIRSALGNGLDTGDVKVTNATLDDVLVALLEGE